MFELATFCLHACSLPCCPLVNGFVDDALRDAGPCVNEALLQVDCVTDRRLVGLQTLLHQAPNAVIDWV